jgi:hypothetical protein
MRKLSLSLLPLLVFLAPVGAKLSRLRARAAAPAVASAATGADEAAAREVRERIARAKQLLEARKIEPAPDEVALAVEDSEGGQIHVLTLPKATLLQQGATAQVVSSLGETLKVSVVRPNFVNTALRVADGAGKELTPLVVEYPRTEGKKVKEIAYYTSAHPALAAPALTRDGGAYIRRMLDAAAADLRARGEKIDPSVV